MSERSLPPLPNTSQVVDGNRAARMIGCTKITAEKFLIHEGLYPVGQILNRTGYTRYYKIEDVQAAKKRYPAYLKSMMAAKIEKANSARPTVTAARVKRLRQADKNGKIKVLADPESIKKLEHLAEALADVLGLLPK